MEPKKDTSAAKRVPGTSTGALPTATAGRPALRGTEATAASTGAKPAGSSVSGGKSTLTTTGGAAASTKPIEEVKDGESSGYSDFVEEELE